MLIKDFGARPKDSGKMLKHFQNTVEGLWNKAGVR